jgi:hypothetical protein
MTRVPLRATAAKLAERLRTDSQRFWVELPARYKRDREAYVSAVDRFISGNIESDRWRWDPQLPKTWGGWGQEASGNNSYPDDLHALLRSVTSKLVTAERNGHPFSTWVQCPPRRVLQADIKSCRPATNRTLSFSCGSECGIIFKPDGHSVSWYVGENNHARDYGREHPLAKLFFRELEELNWTRGSGGEIIGNDEYNQDAGYATAGAGGSYVISAYGPRGGQPVGVRPRRAQPGERGYVGHLSGRSY